MEIDQYLIWTGILALAIILLAIIRIIKKKKIGNSRFIPDTFQTASSQTSQIDIKLKDSKEHSGLAGHIESVRSRDIIVQTARAVPESWIRQPVEAYFRIIQDGSPVFFVFESRISRMDKGIDGAKIYLDMPEHIRVEKKRLFNRTQPAANDILMLALWPLEPGKRLPRRNNELGQPAASWKKGQSDPELWIDNISAAGIAISFRENKSLDLDKGSQLTGLLVYRIPGEESPIVFLFTGEIMNCRKSSDIETAGLEFTNWAVQKQVDAEIHWSHSSPWRGVKPIHLWVESIEKNKITAAKLSDGG